MLLSAFILRCSGARFSEQPILDAFVVNNGSENQIYRDDGTNSAGVVQFSDSPAVSGLASNSLDVALGDLDGDGDLDAFVVNDGEENQIYMNDGSGRFTASPASSDTNSSAGLALGDLFGE